MAPTFRAPASSGNGGSVASPERRGPRPPRWGTNGKVDPAALAAARELGLHTAKSAEHAMAQAFDRVAVFAKHLLATPGGDVRLAHHMADLNAVLAGVGAAPITWEQILELAQREQSPDGEEDVHQLALVAANTRETRRAFLRAADREIAALQRLRAAVATYDAAQDLA